MDQWVSIAQKFSREGKIVTVEEFGNGNVHDTYLVTRDLEGEPHFLLQRINRSVFPQPELVMRNMRVVTDHMLLRLKDASRSLGFRWEVPRVLTTGEGRDHHVDERGSFWRAMSFIDGTQTFDTIQNEEHAGEVGAALGVFHRLVCDLPAGGLADTLEGFHVTPRYLARYDSVLERSPLKNSPELNHVKRFVNRRRGWASTLEEAKARGALVVRPTHGDPKINNILVDRVSRKAVAMVDLDTVKPGLLQHDIGDCVRSCCNPMGEDTLHWEDVQFDANLCQIVLKAYHSQARDFLTQNDRLYLLEAIRLLPFELGLRFFTDHLEGNVYFKVRTQEQNLVRALVQFRLTESIEKQWSVLGTIIRGLR